MKRILVGVVGVSLLGLSVGSLAQSKPSIQGVWTVAETTGGLGAPTDKPDAVNSRPQPGFYIFTPRHYSITRVYGDKPRMVPKDANNPTVPAYIWPNNCGPLDTAGVATPGACSNVNPNTYSYPNSLVMRGSPGNLR